MSEKHEVVDRDDDNDQDLEVEIDSEEETPEVETEENPGRVSQEDEYSERVRKRFAKMTAKIKREQEEKEKLRRELIAERAEKSQAQNRTMHAEYYAIEKHETALNEQKALWTRKMEQAKYTGDVSAEVEALDKISNLNAEMTATRYQKQNYKTQYDNFQKQQPPRQQQPVKQRDDDVEPEHVDQAREFLKRNQSWMTDRDTDRAVQIEQQMVGQGYDPTDPTFWKKLEVEIKGGNRGSTVAGTGRTGVKQSRRVSLSREDMAFCQKMGISPKSYAAEKLKLEKGNR